MGIETEIKQADLISLWRQFKSERESFLAARDRILKLIADIKSTDFDKRADVSEKALLADLESKAKAIDV